MRRRNRSQLMFVACIAVTLFSCSASQEADQQDRRPFVVSGVVQYISLNDGCWRLLGDDGLIYQLAGDHTGQLLKDGMKVEVRVCSVETTEALCSSDKTVELLEIIQTTNE